MRGIAIRRAAAIAENAQPPAPPVAQRAVAAASRETNYWDPTFASVQRSSAPPDSLHPHDWPGALGNDGWNYGGNKIKNKTKKKRNKKITKKMRKRKIRNKTKKKKNKNKKTKKRNIKKITKKRKNQKIKKTKRKI